MHTQRFTSNDRAATGRRRHEPGQPCRPISQDRHARLPRRKCAQSPRRGRDPVRRLRVVNVKITHIKTHSPPHTIHVHHSHEFLLNPQHAPDSHKQGNLQETHHTPKLTSTGDIPIRNHPPTTSTMFLASAQYIYCSSSSLYNSKPFI